MTSKPAISSASPTYIETISSALIQARKSAAGLAQFPGDLPADLDQAYRVQHQSIKAWPENPAGWKIGGIPAALATLYNKTRLVGPIFPSTIVYVEEGSTTKMPIFDTGFAAVEAEFIYIIGKDIAPGAAPARSAILEHVASLHVGIEMASSPLQNINTMGPLAVICDFGNNAGLMVGPEVKNWRSRSFDDMGVTVTIDGTQVGSARATAIGGGAIESLEFLVGHCADMGITLTKGTAVTTGAVSGVHQVLAGQHTRADFGPDGTLYVDTIPMTPR